MKRIINYLYSKNVSFEFKNQNTVICNKITVTKHSHGKYNLKSYKHGFIPAFVMSFQQTVSIIFDL